MGIDPDIMSQLADPACPDSSRRVMEVLDAASSPLSPSQLVDLTGLKRRTLYVALRCLGQRDMIRVGVSLRDARRRRYIIDDAYARGRWRQELAA